MDIVVTPTFGGVGQQSLISVNCKKKSICIHYSEDLYNNLQGLIKRGGGGGFNGDLSYISNN